jgi:uncharacterized protein with HEPN domain
VRREDEIVADIVRHGRLVLDLVGDLEEAMFLQRFGDGITSFAAAISFALVVIGESCRQLAGVGGVAGAPPAAPIVEANPEIDWRGWIGLRNVLTHGYHRRDPPAIWRAMDELRVLVQTCEAWQGKRSIPDDDDQNPCKGS